MPGPAPTVERAFQMARSGEFSGLREIAAGLVREGHFDVEEHLEGPLLRRQLREIYRRSAGEHWRKSN